MEANDTPSTHSTKIAFTSALTLPNKPLLDFFIIFGLPPDDSRNFRAEAATPQLLDWYPRQNASLLKGLNLVGSFVNVGLPVFGKRISVRRDEHNRAGNSQQAKLCHCHRRFRE